MVAAKYLGLLGQISSWVLTVENRFGIAPYERVVFLRELLPLYGPTVEMDFLMESCGVMDGLKSDLNWPSRFAPHT